MTASDLTHQIAAHAARLIVEEGLDWGSAKRRAAREVGAPARARLPDNTLLQAQVREHIALFCADTQPAELHALRALALVWMRRLAEFRPHIGGAVWNGTATRRNDIYLQLFCDDPKSAELALINHGVDYDAQQAQGFNGAEVTALSISAPCPALGEHIGIHLMIHDADELRGALLPDEQGRRPRGSADALQKLLQNEADGAK